MCMDYFDGKFKKNYIFTIRLRYVDVFAKASFVYLNNCGTALAMVSMIVLFTGLTV